MLKPSTQPAVIKMANRTHIDFFLFILVFLLFRNWKLWGLINEEKSKGKEERLQRGNLNPYGAFTWYPSGKSIS
jgi:hypothetical protein